MSQGGSGTVRYRSSGSDATQLLLLVSHFMVIDYGHDSSSASLDVPGLAEKRPSVLVGDRILVQPAGSTNGHWFEGGVHVVRREEVGLRLHGSFKATLGSQFHIRFKLNRYPLRRQHMALDTVFAQQRVLFPGNAQLSSKTFPTAKDVRVVTYNPLLRSNPPQLQAVISIMQRPPGSIPFIVFGP